MLVRAPRDPDTPGGSRPVTTHLERTAADQATPVRFLVHDDRTSRVVQRGLKVIIGRSASPSSIPSCCRACHTGQRDSVSFDRRQSVTLAPRYQLIFVSHLVEGFLVAEVPQRCGAGAAGVLPLGAGRQRILVSFLASFLLSHLQKAMQSFQSTCMTGSFSSGLLFVGGPVGIDRFSKGAYRPFALIGFTVNQGLVPRRSCSPSRRRTGGTAQRSLHRNPCKRVSSGAPGWAGISSSSPPWSAVFRSIRCLAAEHVLAQLFVRIFFTESHHKLAWRQEHHLHADRIGVNQRFADMFGHCC